MEFMTSLQCNLDEQKPSLFELLSEQQLSALIPPSLRYLLAVATHRNPRYLLRVLNSFDELYALLALVVERYYLQTYGGGFTENFYGLKRERVLRIRGGEARRAQLGAPAEVRETLQLRSADVWRNLAVMVALPYFKRKLDESYDVHASGIGMLGPAYREREAYPADGNVKARLMWLYKWFLRRVYPSVNAAYYFSLLAFNLAYLFDGSKYHSPWLWLIGTRMRRLNEADSRAIALATQAPAAIPDAGARPGQTTSLFSRHLLTRTVYPRLLSSLKVLLPTSIFALKFLEWWHASDFARQLSRKANEGLELPPPVVSGLAAARRTTMQSEKEDDTLESSPLSKPRSIRCDSGVASAPVSTITGLPIFTVTLPATKSIDDEDDEGSMPDDAVCPICLGSIQTPTATQTGYVYCYTCIYKWVDGTHARQEAFMESSAAGGGSSEAWRDETDAFGGGGGSREGRWESGKGRDPVTGRRLLGGTSGLRRVMV